MRSKTITLSDTGEEMTFQFETPVEMLSLYSNNILGANELEGRPETTYWRDPIKKEEYRLSCLSKVEVKHLLSEIEKLHNG
jgi:hypothetical protein